MQDEVNTKVVAIAIKGGKITAEVLDKALKKFVEEIEKAQKNASQPKTYRGKQSIKHLVEQNAAISNIEVTDGNIKAFERTANKYGIDYALKKDTSEQPPRYLVFFKGRDVDVMTQAFKEFSAKKVKQNDKPSLKQKLSRSREQAKAQHKEKVKVKSKDRGVELTAMKGIFANALAPVIERVVYWLKYAFAYLNLFIKTLTGVDMVAEYNAKALNKQAEATAKTAKATKEANNQLAAFDEKNMLNDNTSNTADDTSASSSAALLELPDVSGGKFEEICETIKAHINELETILGVALIATGFILLAVGQIPMGIACIVAGIAVMAVALSGWSELSAQTQAMITAIMTIAGGAFLAIGLILIGTGVKMALGIAMVAIGAAMLVSALALNWNEMPEKIKTMISVIMAVVAVALLVIGFIVISHNMPLGIALIALGAVALVSTIALNWDKIKENIEIIIGTILAVVSVALLVIGAILAFSGAHIVLGIALIAAGAIGLCTSLALMWNKLPDNIKNVISIIAAAVGAALLVLGVILCATGVALPLGIALIAAGAALMITAVALNKDAVANWVSDAWAKVKSFWNNSIKPIFTKEWWKKKFDTIKQGMKDALNGVIDVIERTFNSVVAKLNSFKISIPDWVPKYGGASLGFNFPYAHIPRLAKGAIVNNPGKGRVVTVGEAGAEAILPLHNNTEWMDVLVDKVAEAISMNVMNKIYLDGKEIHSSNRKYSSRFAFATNGGVL